MIILFLFVQVGYEWRDIQYRCLRGRLKPTLLFYEAETTQHYPDIPLSNRYAPYVPNILKLQRAVAATTTPATTAAVPVAAAAAAATTTVTVTAAATATADNGPAANDVPPSSASPQSSSDSSHTTTTPIVVREPASPGSSPAHGSNVATVQYSQTQLPLPPFGLAMVKDDNNSNNNSDAGMSDVTPSLIDTVVQPIDPQEMEKLEQIAQQQLQEQQQQENQQQPTHSTLGSSQTRRSSIGSRLPHIKISKIVPTDPDAESTNSSSNSHSTVPGTSPSSPLTASFFFVERDGSNASTAVVPEDIDILCTRTNWLYRSMSVVARDPFKLRFVIFYLCVCVLLSVTLSLSSCL